MSGCSSGSELDRPAHRPRQPRLVTPLCGVTGPGGAPRHGWGRGAERRQMRYTAERCNEGTPLPMANRNRQLQRRGG